MLISVFVRRLCNIAFQKYLVTIWKNRSAYNFTLTTTRSNKLAGRGKPSSVRRLTCRYPGHSPTTGRTLCPISRPLSSCAAMRIIASSGSTTWKNFLNVSRYLILQHCIYSYMGLKGKIYRLQTSKGKLLSFFLWYQVIKYFSTQFFFL